jgi:hypothetical protein
MDGIPWVLDELPRHQFHHKPKPPPQPKHHDRPPKSPRLPLHLDTITEGSSNRPRPSFFGSSKGSSLSPSAESPVDGFDHFAPAEASTSSSAATTKKANKPRLWWGRKGGN